LKRITTQKQIILDFLRKSKIHPDADQVFLEVRKKLPRISKATVYRILDTFVDEKLIVAISGKKTRFDGNKIPHQHFLCTNCGLIVDIFDDETEKYLNKKKEIIKEGKAENFNLTFYGKCKKCRKKIIKK